MFPSGTWLLDRDCWTDGSDFPPPCEQLWGGWGIIVPEKVNLIGAAGPGAASRPTIETRGKFDRPYLKQFSPTVDPHVPVHQFTLMGSNLVQGLWFHDSYRPNYPDTGSSSPGANALYVLGDDITITDNVFEATYSAIEAWWHRLPGSSLGKGLHGEDLIGNRNVVVTGNTFAVYGHSGAVGFAVLKESVISRNTFLAGAYPLTVALGTHSGCHVDISANIVNGIDQTHSGNLIGWRAGIFLSHTASQENILVAGNRFSCIESRSGVDAAYKSDGEAISTDAPGTILAFRSGQRVTDAPARPSQPQTTRAIP